MWFKDHVKITEIIFKEGFPEVHRWIDALAVPFFDEGCPYMHWVKRHNLDALELKYGKNSKKFLVGVVHIFCDIISHFAKFYEVPQSTSDVEAILKQEKVWVETHLLLKDPEENGRKRECMEANDDWRMCCEGRHCRKAKRMGRQ